MLGNYLSRNAFSRRNPVGKRNTAMRKGQRHVFVVDDDEAVRDSIQFLLETAGFNVTPFGSAVDFLAAQERDVLGCVLLDLQMPHVSGLELMRILGARGTKLSVALMSGSMSPELKCRALELGVQEIIEKPLDANALLQFVSHAAT
jgi:two-component system, LuxR family, response regulator FixJ